MCYYGRVATFHKDRHVSTDIDVYKRQDLPQDETAIAVLMMGMRRYIEEGLECYPLAEGLQDAYALILINEALKSPGRPVRSETQIWAGI